MFAALANYINAFWHMLNLLSEKRLNKTVKSIGFLGFSNGLNQLMELLRDIPNTSFAGVYSSQNENESKSFTNNPFGLITNSDIIVANKSDKQSLNLIIESFLNSKHVLLAYPFSLELNEFYNLEKLCSEGRTHLLANINFKNWELIESLVNNGKQAEHIEISVKTTSIYDLLTLKQKVFEIIYLLHAISSVAIKRILLNQVSIMSYKNGYIKLWVEFENTCIATVLIDATSASEDFSVKIFQKEQIAEGLINENKIVISKSNDQNEIISFDSRTTYQHYVFEKLWQNDNQEWFDNHLNIYRKSLQQFQKLLFKFPFNKK